MIYSKRNIKSQNIIDLVDSIKLRYEQVFDDLDDIYYLYYFLNGHLGAKIQLNSAEKIDEYFQFNFSKWMSNKYKDKLSHDTSWVKIIKILSKDKAKHLEIFFLCFDEFVKFPDGLESPAPRSR